MKFKSIHIKNFRNFEDISIELDNKNVLFGMNDIGKTNFLYALRVLFDKNIRKQNLVDSDYYKKNTETPIEIIVKIDISDTEDENSQKLRAKLKGAILSNQNDVYIKLLATYDEKEMLGIPELYWGGDLNELEQIKARGTFYDIDYVFNVIYIDSYVDLYSLFKKNVNSLLVNDTEQDKTILDDILHTCNDLNTHISQLSGVKKFENTIAPEYKNFRHEDVSVSVKSEIVIKGLYSNLVPYIKKGGDDSLYPTSGEGRKKFLVYSIFNILAKEEAEKKINLFLVEEPENHLHRSMQISLSYNLFQNNPYQFLFLTTHSPYILSEMDKVNLVRIYNDDKIVSRSTLYSVPPKFSKQRKILNRGLVEAVFADKVLLVEGPSECVLFGKILSELNPFYEANGIYILPVSGVGFEPYLNILKPLNIKCIIKTDNDLRKPRDAKTEEYSALGFLRINKYVPDKPLPENKVKENSVEAKRKLYNENKTILDRIREEHSIYLSRCSLEEDLDEAFHDQMVQYLPATKDGPVKYLQDKKNYHMVELAEKLDKKDCLNISNHYNFACLKEVLA